MTYSIDPRGRVAVCRRSCSGRVVIVDKSDRLFSHSLVDHHLLLRVRSSGRRGGLSCVARRCVYGPVAGGCDVGIVKPGTSRSPRRV